ncbi:MAG: PAS domain-containing protein [Myxococcales bacterium]|nr:PAS domain-containing protein [Myxococcales bacterium]
MIKNPALSGQKEAPPDADRASLQSAESPHPGIPIVGIGVSAGGLEALEQLLPAVPLACGLAFVVVQHLAPDRHGLLVELLQRVTAMPVLEITDGMPVAPDHIYVIPSNRDLSISRGVLHLREWSAPQAARHPIDSFFRTLAEDQNELSIGVILSGMGCDGTLGLRAIKERGGATFAQTPASAKFDSMPRSAIDTGLADVVAPPAQLMARILAYHRHLPSPHAESSQDEIDRDRSTLDKIVSLVRTQIGHDFSLYKKNTIYRRIKRRMSLHGLAKMTDYLQLLRENPQESELLFHELLIGVTSFFRDRDMWEQLKSQALPALLSALPRGGKLRAWSVGCSTGEEAYSLAITFHEALEEQKSAARYSMQIFATDLDRDAINKARAGIYPAQIADDISETRLRRFFVREERGYRVSPQIREMVIFARQNVIIEPPFTKLDLLICRNLLIYLESDLQKRLLPLFHYSLNPNGILVLGSSESVGQATDLFAQLTGKTRLYRRYSSVPRSDQLDFPAGFSRPHVEAAPLLSSPLPVAPTALNLQAMTDALVVQRYSPPAVLTTSKGDIVYISGKTGKYLEPAAGKININLFAMARPGLGGALNESFARALREQTTITMKDVSVDTYGGPQVVDVIVQYLSEPAPLQGMLLVVFADVVAPASAPAQSEAGPNDHYDARLSTLTKELEQSREELRTTREAMQAAQEELKSRVEELQSENEELQSTNEELTTSKEELQSMNEELQTVNHELQTKVDDLSRASDDMKNLLNSTGIATLFLDNDLNVRRFTTQVASIIKLIPSDAGRPITDLVSELDYPTLVADAQEVLRTLIFHEQQVSARNGRWFTVRIIPYRTMDSRIDGVVITFTDLSSVMRAKQAMGEALAVLQSRVNDQAAQLDASRTLEGVLQQAQAILESRLAELMLELDQTRRDLHGEKRRKL